MKAHISGRAKKQSTFILFLGKTEVRVRIRKGQTGNEIAAMWRRKAVRMGFTPYYAAQILPQGVRVEVPPSP